MIGLGEIKQKKIAELQKAASVQNGKAESIAEFLAFLESLVAAALTIEDVKEIVWDYHVGN